MMKTLILATSLAIASGTVTAQSFAYERDLGTPDLFPTLNTEGVGAYPDASGRRISFAYERAVNTPDLFPTLHHDGQPQVRKSERVGSQVPVSRDVFARAADNHS